MNKQTKKLGALLFTGLFAAGIGTAAFAPGGGFSAFAEGESAHVITLKLNGGERLVADVRNGADVTYTFGGDSLKLTHDNVRAMFSNAAPYLYGEDGTYLSDQTDAKGKYIYSTPLLYGLFADANGNGILDDGERLYCSGDTLKVTDDITLTCYYRDDMIYSLPVWGEEDIWVTLVKAWKPGNEPVDKNPVKRSYKAREIQLLYHQVSFIGDLAFSTGGWCDEIESVEIPDTALMIGYQAFFGAYGCTSVTGLDSVYGIDAEAFKNSNVEEIVLSNLNYFSHYAFCLNANTSRIIVEGWENGREELVKWCASGRENNPTPWFGVTNPSLTSPNAYLYVPAGKTESWYLTENAQLKLTNGEQWTGTVSEKTYETSFNIPMREMYTVTFDLNGADGYIANQHQDAGAVSVKENGKELNLTSYDDDSGDQLTCTNEAERDLRLLNVRKPADPVLEGKMFLGWQDSEGNLWTDADFGENGKVLSKDEKLTAQWAAPAMLTLKLNNGEEDIVSYVADGCYLNEADMDEPIREGYSFNGWYKDEALTVAWNFETDTVEGDTVIYVGWEADEYTISYNPNGGTLSEDVRTSYTVEDSLTFETPTKEGYAFAGWYANAAFTGDPLTGIEAGTTGNKTLYAKWTAVEYTIAYHLDGGTAGEDAPAVYTAESAVTLVAPTKEGYIFKGWYTNEQLTGEPVTELAAGSVGNKEFWAKWERSEEQDSTSSGDSGTSGDSVTSGNSGTSADSGSSGSSSEGGCGSVLGFGVLSGAALAVCAAAVFKKRRSDK